MSIGVRVRLTWPALATVVALGVAWLPSGPDGSPLRAQEAAPTGSWRVFAGTRTAPGNFDKSIGLATDPQGNVYVADSHHARIQKLSPTGQSLAAWGSVGDGPGRFVRPVSLAVDADDNVYVADLHAHRILVFSPSGEPIAAWGSRGTGPGQLDWPEAVAGDAQRNVYVADQGNQRIQAFTAASMSPTRRTTESRSSGRPARRRRRPGPGSGR